MIKNTKRNADTGAKKLTKDKSAAILLIVIYFLSTQNPVFKAFHQALK